MRNSDADIWEMIEGLERAKAEMTKGAFAELEKNVGWNWVPNSYLLNGALRSMLPPSRFLFDPLHIYYSQGILGIEVKLLLDQFSAVQPKTLVEAVHAAAQAFCARKKPNLLALEPKYFSEEQWKANASTQLSLWPLLHFALETSLPDAIRGRIETSLKSFRLLCEDLKFVLLLKHAGLKSALHCWQHVQTRHMEAFVLAHGKDALRPKHHFRLHLAEDFSKFECMYDCNTMERKHRLCKAEINARGNCLKAVDDYITPRMCLLQLEEMNKYRFSKKKLGADTVLMGSLEIKAGTPLIFPETSTLMVPQRWLLRLDGLHAEGCCYRSSQQLSGNITLWTFIEPKVVRSLEKPWLLPMYWRQSGMLFETIL